MSATRSARASAPVSPMAWVQRKWLTLVAHTLALTPLLLLVTWYFRDDLGADPINTINNMTGRAAIILLAFSLAATPIYIATGWSKPITVRRALGLYAFLYALLHFANFIGLDYALDLNAILQDALLSKPYIIVGLGALLILLALALTSTKASMRRLGRNWLRLHRLVYLAGALAALHFYWQAKAAARLDPLIYAAILTALLVVRIPPIRHAIVRTRQQLAAKVASTSS